MSVAEILDRAAERLSKPGAWTQGRSARGGDGYSASPWGRRACCWCVAGAIFCETGGVEEQSMAALRALTQVLPKKRNPIAAFNDAPGRQQAEVVAKLRQAANLAQEQGK